LVCAACSSYNGARVAIKMTEGGSINTSILFIIKSFRKSKDNNGIWVWFTRKSKLKHYMRL